MRLENTGFRRLLRHDPLSQAHLQVVGEDVQNPKRVAVLVPTLMRILAIYRGIQGQVGNQLAQPSGKRRLQGFGGYPRQQARQRGGVWHSKLGHEPQGPAQDRPLQRSMIPCNVVCRDISPMSANSSIGTKGKRMPRFLRGSGTVCKHICRLCISGLIGTPRSMKCAQLTRFCLTLQSSWSCAR